MAHLLKVAEWQDTAGRWRVADTSDLANDSAAWWYPARMLNMPLEEYINLLINLLPSFNNSSKATEREIAPS